MEIDWVAEGFGKEPEFKEFIGVLLEDTDDVRGVFGWPSRQEEAAARAKKYFNELVNPASHFEGATHVIMSERDARLTTLILSCYMNRVDPFKVPKPKHRHKEANFAGITFQWCLGKGTPTEKTNVQLANDINDAVNKVGKEKIAFNDRTVGSKIKHYSWWDCSKLQAEDSLKLQLYAEKILINFIQSGRFNDFLKGK